MSKDESINEMLKILKEHEREFRENFGIKDIGIFGSYVRGSQKEGSDIDVLVEFLPNAEMDLIKFVELEDYLSVLLGKKVDLVMKSALKPRLEKYILREVVYISIEK